jgi:hypothetical protein
MRSRQVELFGCGIVLGLIVLAFLVALIGAIGEWIGSRFGLVRSQSLLQFALGIAVFVAGIGAVAIALSGTGRF